MITQFSLPLTMTCFHKTNHIEPSTCFLNVVCAYNRVPCTRAVFKHIFNIGVRKMDIQPTKNSSLSFQYMNEPAVSERRENTNSVVSLVSSQLGLVKYIVSTLWCIYLQRNLVLKHVFFQTHVSWR